MIKRTFIAIKYVFVRLLQLNRLVILLYVLFVLLRIADSYVLKIYSEKILNLIGEHASFATMILVTVFWFGAAFLVAFLKKIFDSMKTPQIIKATQDMERKVTERNLNVNYEMIENPEYLNEEEKARGTLNSINSGFQGVIHATFSIVEALGSVLIFFIILGISNIGIVLVAFLLSVCGYLLSKKTAKYEHQQNEELVKHKRKANYFFDQMCDFAAGKDMRIYRFFPLIMERFSSARDSEINVRIKIKKMYLRMGIAGNVINMAGNIIIYLLYLFFYFSGKITIGRFSLLLASTNQAINMLQMLVEQFSRIGGQSYYIEELEDFLKPKDEEEKSLETVPKPDNCGIRLEHVSFRYAGTHEYIFQDFSLNINPGEKLALVGYNGAGKTTLVKLICGLLRPEKGTIYVNGVDISRVDKREYYKLISAVFQEICIFAFSAEENVALTEDGINYKKVEHCLEMVGLHKRIYSLPRKEKTPMLKNLDKDGVELSGGERQRLAFARALYKEAPITVLDEPTSALDPIGEYDMYRTFDENVKGKTSIYISHRVPFAKLCDNVAFLDNGKLVEYGPHEELMKLDGLYAGFYNMQAKYYLKQ